MSCSFNLEIETGPNISSGVLKRDIRYSNELPCPNIIFSRRAIILMRQSIPKVMLISDERYKQWQDEMEQIEVSDEILKLITHVRMGLRK